MPLNTPAGRGDPWAAGPRGDGLGDVLERASRAPSLPTRALVRRIERQILCRHPLRLLKPKHRRRLHQARSWRGTRRKFPCPPAPPEP